MLPDSLPRSCTVRVILQELFKTRCSTKINQRFEELKKNMRTKYSRIAAFGQGDAKGSNTPVSQLNPSKSFESPQNDKFRSGARNGWLR
jgi:hypothetical protein